MGGSGSLAVKGVMVIISDNLVYGTRLHTKLMALLKPKPTPHPPPQIDSKQWPLSCLKVRPTSAGVTAGNTHVLISTQTLPQLHVNVVTTLAPYGVIIMQVIQDHLRLYF